MRLASSIDPGNLQAIYNATGVHSTITYMTITRKQIPRTTEAREQVGNVMSDVAILSQNTG